MKKPLYSSAPVARVTDRYVVTLCRLLIGLTLASCQKDVAPSGCRLVVQASTDTYTYQFDEAGKLAQLHATTAGNEADFHCTYRGRQATLEVTYPKADYLRISLELTLNEQGYVLTAQQTQFNRLADGTTQVSLTANHTFAYDPQGYLTDHRVDTFSYPPGTPKRTETYEDHLIYQDGNPVDIVRTYLAPTQRVLQIRNRYDGRGNPLSIPFLIESNPFGFSAEWSLQPFMGKPAQHLIVHSEILEPGRQGLPTDYLYQFDESGQVRSVARNGPQLYGLFFSGHCP